MALRHESIGYLVVMVCWRLSSFATQGFIFLSGFKMIYTMAEKPDLKRFYLGKITKVYLPYVLWVVLYYGLFIVLKFLPEQNHTLAILKHILLGDLVGHLYFVPVIMQFYILMPLWVFLCKKMKPSVAIVLSLLATVAFSLLPSVLKFIKPGLIFGGNDRLFTSYLVYFAMGAYAGANFEKFGEFVRKRFKAITAIFVLLAAVDLVMSYTCYRALAKIYLLDQVHILYSVFAILFVYGLAGKTKKFAENKLVKNIDGASYYIYLSHCFFIFLINHLMAYLEIYAEKFTYPIRTVVVYTVSIVLCCGYVKLKNMRKFHKNME